MGTILASVIENRVAQILQDNANVRWSEPELLGWLNDAQRAVCLARPNAYVLNQNLKLVAGTKQTVPTPGNVFMSINRNMGVAGATPGRVPRFIGMEELGQQNPNWHVDSASATVLHYTFDLRDPGHFYVYPQQPTSNQGYIELVYSAAPPDISVKTNPIVLDDLYQNALIEFMLYRCYSKDATNLKNMAAATGYLTNFVTMVTGKARGEKEDNATANSNGRKAAEQ